MLKKLIIFGTFFLLILVPISSAIETSEEKDIVNSQLTKYTDLCIVELINQINETILYEYLNDLVSIGSRFTGSQGAKDASEFLYNEFTSMGLDTYIDPWKFPDYKCQNVIATINGTDTTSDAVIVVCAHYDTICHGKDCESEDDCPGANDDGTGVVALLLIAKILSQYNIRHTIRFVALSGEEVGTYGSFADVKKAYANNENIIAVLNIDTIGYAHTDIDGKYIQVFAKKSVDWIVEITEKLCDDYFQFIDLKISKGTYYPADHESYFDYGYDSLMFCQPNPQNYHDIHSPRDTIDKINFSYFNKTAKLMLALTSRIANKPIDVQIRIIEPKESYIYIKKIPILHLPGIFNHWAIGIRGLTYLLGKTTVKYNITLGQNEEIDVITYLIDGYMWHLTDEKIYEWDIDRAPYSYFSLNGRHTLSVTVLTKSKKVAYDEMDIFVICIN